MIHVVVVDDDPHDARELVSRLHAWARERGTRLRVTVHTDGADAVAGHDPGTDLLLMDVEMPGLDGLTAAARIHERDPDVPIVLVTRAAAHALRGYAVGASGFLVKPAPEQALHRELDRAVDLADDRAARAGASLQLAADVGPLHLAAAEIVCLEAARRRVRVDTLRGPHVVAGPLKDLEARLAGQGFFRCHHGFLVNLRHVVEVRQHTCRLVTRREVPVSRPNRTAFLAALTDHLAGARA